METEEREKQELADRLQAEAKRIRAREQKKAQTPIMVERYRKVISGKSIGQLTAKHREIARQVVSGKTNGEIAQEMDMSYQTVACIKTSPVVKAHVQQLQEVMDASALYARSKVHEMLPDAVEALNSLLSAKTESTRLRAAQTTLGICGLTPPKNINIDERKSIITSQDYLELQQRADEADRHREKTIDV